LGLHGSIDVEDAIAYSCNIFFDRLGLDLGMDRITDYTRRLGLGVSTGIELGDAAGVVASKDYAETLENYVWRDFDEASGAIGQSLHLYTPIQLSVYMSSVVNGGTRYGAHLLKSINQGEKVIVARKPEAEDVLKISSGAYSTLMSGMRGVITKNDALARYFSGVDVAVGGKTGTAQTSNETDNALFSGFAPFDKPQIVATCVLEEGEVGNNAAKVVAAIFEEYFNPSEEEVED
jgi:penicillin-binding protein 2